MVSGWAKSNDSVARVRDREPRPVAARARRKPRPAPGRHRRGSRRPVARGRRRVSHAWSCRARDRGRRAPARPCPASTVLLNDAHRRRLRSGGGRAHGGEAHLDGAGSARPLAGPGAPMTASSHPPRGTRACQGSEPPGPPMSLSARAAAGQVRDSGGCSSPGASHGVTRAELSCCRGSGRWCMTRVASTWSRKVARRASPLRGSAHVPGASPMLCTRIFAGRRAHDHVEGPGSRGATTVYSRGRASRAASTTRRRYQHPALAGRVVHPAP